MGGKSESKLEVTEAGIASWKGTLRVEGGGFCGVRSKVTPDQPGLAGTM